MFIPQLRVVARWGNPTMMLLPTLPAAAAQPNPPTCCRRHGSDRPSRLVPDERVGENPEPHSSVRMCSHALVSGFMLAPYRPPGPTNHIGPRGLPNCRERG